MKKFLILVSISVLVLSLAMFVGCSRQDTSGDTQANTEIATHDCDGGCGMKDVPVDKMVEKDGKFYCAGCAARMETEDHTGHDHD